MYVIRRDNKAHRYDKNRIFEAIASAFKATAVSYMDSEIDDIINSLHLYNYITIECISDQVEVELMKRGYYSVAKAFIIYREQHRKDRELDKKKNYIAKYLKPSNAATASEFDSNANVTEKNIATTGYFHRVNNKIVAIPTRNLFLWSMLNYGKVNIAGADLNTDMQIQACPWLRIDMALAYSYQRAVDVTNANSKTYQNQIPYTPYHSGSARLVFHTSWFALHYTLQAVGTRYTLGQNILQNRLDPYCDHNMGISTDVPVKNVLFTLGADVLNMANKNYEVVANFPVQGISWRINVEIKW